MRNKKENINDNNKEAKEKRIVDEAIDDFVSQRELLADSIDAVDSMNIPVTLRLNMFKVAELDHLAKRWRTTRSALACELLEKMLSLVLRRVYIERTPEEFYQLQTEIVREYEIKRKGNKKLKNRE